jgi:hypothetical protein
MVDSSLADGVQCSQRWALDGLSMVWVVGARFMLVFLLFVGCGVETV